jgi:hypothetical protein
MPAFAAATRATIVDPAPFLAERLADWLVRHPDFDVPGAGALRLLCSGDPAVFRAHGARFLGAELPEVGHVAEEGGRLMHRAKVQVVVGQVLR